ncbi:MAG: hypothetical protein SAJ12_23820 [Jaaginema sp. PMC 1079.18]|nr:hypothetical protein [Jaaginema sp. PMC 1080.18]MEC4854022.1 hypothetical protein [Jaaginema sp. PMC 1079.18]MEC4866648.1 hypothetical protein [Jaaginema sp. PMC 1078.18]
MKWQNPRNFVSLFGAIALIAKSIHCIETGLSLTQLSGDDGHTLMLRFINANNSNISQTVYETLQL